MTRPSESTIKPCLAAQMFYPRYGDSTLRFLGYLPGFRARGIDCGVLTGAPLAEETTAAENTEQWKQYRMGEMLPVEKVNDTPVHRARLPEHKSIRRSGLFNRALLQHCGNPDYRPDVTRLLGTLRLKAVPALSRLRAKGIPLVYAVPNTSKLVPKTNRSRLRQCRYRRLFNYLECIIVTDSPMLEMMHNMGIASRIEAIQNGTSLQTGARKTDTRGMSGSE